MNRSRKELLMYVADCIEGAYDWFDYYNWDHLLERDEITIEELQWLQAHAAVLVDVVGLDNDIS